MKKNVTLIGMPGSGKSTMGVRLAERLGFNFIDSDLLIIEQQGRRLQDIIDSEGIEAFLKIEEEVNAAIDVENTVIATGGSVIYGPKAMEHLREISKVVYLRYSCETIAERLGDFTQRGVTLPEGWTLQDLYNERDPLYEKYAHVVFDCYADDKNETLINLNRVLWG